ncbi:MAG: hypothetical protein LUE61_05095 [Clostridiales bacterium]|nr:hypothetical protein [Clostridiales bacterium]
MTMPEIEAMLAAGEKTPEEKLRLLKKTRATLMEELHGQQQLVDQVDYLIYMLQPPTKKTRRTRI